LNLVKKVENKFGDIFNINSAKDTREAIGGLAFVAPAVILLAVFIIFPAIMSFYYSLTDFYILTPDKTSFVGLDNYKYLFSEEIFYQALKNTIYFVLVVVPVQVGAALLLAVLINSKRIKGVKFFRTIFYSPVVLSMVVVSILWAILYNPNDGLLNSLLVALGLPKQPFLSSPKQAMNSIIAMSVWQGVGYQMVIFLAGLQDIPESLYEAAEIDGANIWQKFRHITLPGLYNVTVFVLLVTSIAAFGIFVQPYVMTQGGPDGATKTLIMMFFEEGFQLREIGTSSAIVVIYFVMVLTVSILQRKFAKDKQDSVI